MLVTNRTNTGIPSNQHAKQIKRSAMITGELMLAYQGFLPLVKSSNQLHVHITTSHNTVPEVADEFWYHLSLIQLHT